MFKSGRSRELDAVLFDGSVLKDCTLSEALKLVPASAPFRLLESASPFVSLFGVIVTLTGLLGGLSPFLRDPDEKISLILAPGDTPRVLELLEDLSDLSPLSVVAY